MMSRHEKTGAPRGETLDIVDIYEAGDVQEAYALADVLDGDGIFSHVVGDKLGPMAGSIPFGNVRPRIWVARPDANRARQIVTAWERRRADATSTRPTPRLVNALALLYLLLFLISMGTSVFTLEFSGEGRSLMDDILLNGLNLTSAATMLALMYLAFRRKRSDSAEESSSS